MHVPSLKYVGLLAMLSVGAFACTLSHEGLGAGGDVPDVTVVEEDGGVDAIDAERPDIIVADTMDIHVPPMDVQDVQPDIPQDIPQDVPQDIPQDVPQDTAPPPVPAGGDCRPAGSVCATGTQCFSFTGGGGAAAVVCEYCGQAGQRACATGAPCVSGAMIDTFSSICVRTDVGSHCGDPGGACMAPPGCGGCGADQQCVGTGMTIPNACLTCGHIGEPCCCTMTTCSCPGGGACTVGGADRLTVCH